MLVMVESHISSKFHALIEYDGIYSSLMAVGFRVEGDGKVFVLYSWTKRSTSMVPLSTQEDKWVPVNCQGSLMKYCG